MATIVKRPSGKWQATVRKDGQSRSKSFLKRADATKWARETELSADRGLLNPFEVDQTVRQVDFDTAYLGLGMAIEEPDGRIVTTEKWDDLYRKGNKTFDRTLYDKAKSGALYSISEKLFVLAIPKELLLKPKSVRIYTYLSEGSVLLQYLKKLQKDHPGSFTLDVQRLDKEVEVAWREDVANALTVLPIPELENQKWTHCAQLNTIKTHQQCSSVGHKLRKFTPLSAAQSFEHLIKLCHYSNLQPLWKRDNLAKGGA